jgi:hypothetical protein
MPRNTRDNQTTARELSSIRRVEVLLESSLLADLLPLAFEFLSDDERDLAPYVRLAEREYIQ